MPDLSKFLQTSDVLASVALVAILFAVRLLVGHALKRRNDISAQIRRRWTANLRNLLLVVALIGLVMIWAPQLRTFALSITALAVALVVATKELILCLSGAALRTFTRAFSVGDYVEIAGTRGEVMDFNLLVTRLSELEERNGSFAPTGRDVIVPHSLLFSKATRVEGSAGGRVRHLFHLTFEPDLNLFAERGRLESLAREAQKLCEETHGRDVLTAGRRFKSDKADEEGRVQISLGTSEIGKHRITCIAFALPELVPQTEDAIICAIGDHVCRRRRELANGLPDTPAQSRSRGAD